MNSTTGTRISTTAEAREMCTTLAHVLRTMQETVRCTTTVASMPLQAIGRHAALEATPLNRGDTARASKAKPTPNTTARLPRIRRPLQ